MIVNHGPAWKLPCIYILRRKIYVRAWAIPSNVPCPSECRIEAQAYELARTVDGWTAKDARGTQRAIKRGAEKSLPPDRALTFVYMAFDV